MYFVNEGENSRVEVVRLGRFIIFVKFGVFVDLRCVIVFWVCFMFFFIFIGVCGFFFIS